MRIVTSDEQLLDVRRRQSIQLDGEEGTRIECRRGVLWITQEDDPRDVILFAWQSFTIDRRGGAVIHALEASTVRLKEPDRSRTLPRNVARAVWYRLAERQQSLRDLAAMSWHEQRDILGCRSLRQFGW